MCNTTNIVILLFLLLPTFSFCQFNFTTGYQIGVVDYDQVNKITDKYNVTTDYIVSSFKPIKYLQGFKGGIRYKIGNFSLTSDLNVFNKKIKSKYNAGSAEKKSYIKFNNFIFSTGVALNFSILTIGSTFNHTWGIIKSDVHSLGTFKTISLDKFWGNTAFLECRVSKSKLLEVGIRTFWNFNYGSFNTASLDNYLLTSDNSASDDVQSQNTNMIGLSVILYNGKQRN